MGRDILTNEQAFLPQYGLLNEEHIAARLFDFLTNIQNVLPFLSEDAIHLRIV